MCRVALFVEGRNVGYAGGSETNVSLEKEGLRVKRRNELRASGTKMKLRLSVVSPLCQRSLFSLFISLFIECSNPAGGQEHRPILRHGASRTKIDVANNMWHIFELNARRSRFLFHFRGIFSLYLFVLFFLHRTPFLRRTVQ